MVIRSLRLSLLLALGVASLAPRQLDAQVGALLPLARPDSAIWQSVMVYVVGALSSQIVRASTDSSLQPWHLKLPAQEPQRVLLEKQLRTILHARDETSEDSAFSTLELGALRVVRDTARVRFIWDFTKRCPGSARTTGWGNSTDVLVPWYPAVNSSRGGWGVARSVSTLVGDKISCP